MASTISRSTIGPATRTRFPEDGKPGDRDLRLEVARRQVRDLEPALPIGGGAMGHAPRQVLDDDGDVGQRGVARIDDDTHQRGPRVGAAGLGVEPIGAAGADGDDEGQQGQPSRDTGVKHRANLAPEGAGAVAYHGPRDGGVAT